MSTLSASPPPLHTSAKPIRLRTFRILSLPSTTLDKKHGS